MGLSIMAEKIRVNKEDAQREARRQKNAIRKDKRIARKIVQMGGEVAPVEKKAEPVAAAPAKVEDNKAAPAKGKK